MTLLTDLDDHFIECLNAEFRLRASQSFDDQFGKKTAPYSGSCIQIEGHIYHDMFDDVPGMAHFITEHTQYFEVPRFMERRDVREYAEGLYGELKAEYSSFHGGEIFDGLFNPARAVVIGRSGRILDLYEHCLWFDDYLSRNLWSSREEEIHDLLVSASVEHDHDNPTTARHLRETAQRLAREMELSRSFIPRE